MRPVLAAALAASLAAAATPALAQDVPTIIAPLRVATDQNGVNLLSGKLTLDMPALTVPAAPNLRFDRVQNAAPYMTGTSNAGDDGGVSSYSLHTGGGASESFKCNGIDCTSVTLSGSTFAAKQYRQAGSGAFWHFNLRHVDAFSGATRYIQYYASHVDYPNGEQIDYTYETYASGDFLDRVYHRPTRISSSLGYFIAITYQSSSFPSNEWSMPATATLYASAAPSVPLRRLTYSGNMITETAGASSRIFTCTGCTNQLGLDLETSAGSLTLPGEGSATLQVTQNAGAPVVAAVTRDGATWTYSYANLRTGNSGFGWVWDRLIVDGPSDYHAVYDTTGSAVRNVIAVSTDPIGRSTAYQYDIGYRPVRLVAPELNEAGVGYDGYGNIVAGTTTPKPGSGLGPVTATAFYPTDCLTTGTPILCYRPTWSRDGLGRQTDYAWNALGQLVEQTDPADQFGVRKKTYIAYDAASGLSRRSVVRVCGLGSTCGTNTEIRTEYIYWGSTFLPSRERRIDAYYGRTLDTIFSYDSFGRPTSTDGPLPGTDDATYVRYDDYGRKSWEIGARAPNGPRLATRFSYRDSDDKPVAVEQGTVADPANPVLTALSRTDLTYDPGRNLIREAASAGGTTLAVSDRAYDDRGRLQCAATRMNLAALPAATATGACTLGTTGSQGPDRIARNEYDAAGQLLGVKKAFGTPIQQDYAKYEYTLNGRQKAVIDANGNRAEMTFDGFDRQRRWIFPSNTPGLANPADYEEYGYDVVGNRTSLRKRDGSTLTFQYDALNRVIVKIVPERSGLTAAQTRDVYYSYDVSGLPLKARFDNLDGEGVSHYYDLFGRPVTTLIAMGGYYRYVTYYHDDAGNRLSLTWPDNGYVSYAWDAARRMTSVTGNSGTVLATFAYDGFGRRQQLATPGTLTGSGYDALSRLTALTHDLSGSAQDQTLGFAYNPASQIVARSSTNNAYAWTPPYNVSRTYAANGLNQYSASTNAGQAPVAFSYDANGNLLSDGASTFVYDVENRLVSASGGRTASLVYDPLGRLFQVGGAAGTTQFLYDGDELIAEYDPLRRPASPLRPRRRRRRSARLVRRRRRHRPPDPHRQPPGLDRRDRRRERLCDHDQQLRPVGRARAQTMQGGSSIPARPGSPSSACTTTRPASTRRDRSGRV
jgi:YD repeat-containing protein